MPTMDRRPSIIGYSLLIVGFALVITSSLHASDSDLSTSVHGPNHAYLGQTITITVSYSNNGPETADDAFVNAYIPTGVPAPIDQITQGQWDLLQASANGTDTLGNAAVLAEDQRYCEHLVFHLQRDDGDLEADPVEGLDPGVAASFSFELEIPMEPPKFGRVTVTDPPRLAEMWRPATTGWITLEAGVHNLYSRGACDIAYIDDINCDYVYRQMAGCLGNRVSQTDPVNTEIEIVDDGTNDPTLGCRNLIGFTPGNIALIRRGDCMFGDKLFNAYLAGASAALLVNDGRCGDFPDSDQCVIYMDDWGFGELPIVMIAQADGEPIIAALESGETVRGVIGPQDDELHINSLTYMRYRFDQDPTNDLASLGVTIIPQVLQPPTASFTYSPDAPSVGQPIQFTDTSTFSPDAWLWDFGDGSPVSTEQNPAHTFAIGRTYTVSLTVENPMGSDSTELDLVMAESGVRHPSGRRVLPDGP